jgi:hypothetical protein
VAKETKQQDNDPVAANDRQGPAKRQAKKRVLDSSQFMALDQKLDELTDAKLAPSEFLKTLKPKLLKAYNFGYSLKKLAEIASETTGFKFTPAHIRKALNEPTDENPKNHS